MKAIWVWPGHTFAASSGSWTFMLARAAPRSPHGGPKKKGEGTCKCVRLMAAEGTMEMCF